MEIAEAAKLGAVHFVQQAFWVWGSFNPLRVPLRVPFAVPLRVPFAVPLRVPLRVPFGGSFKDFSKGSFWQFL